jgi:glutathione S-transferase
MSELILHQYDTSPFSEKIRKVLAHKRLRWRAVEQPSIMPKPDLLPLTGGYRRIPVLQIGADVWCDTQGIVRTLERLHPTPTIYPGGSEGTCHAWNLWADRLLFLPVVALVFADIGHLVPKEFVDDRTKMMPGRNFAEIPAMAPYAREQVRALLTTVEAQLADRRPWLLGREFSLADAAVYHPLWFLRVAPGAAAALEEFGAVRAWMARTGELGEGERVAMAPAEALAIATQGRPSAGTGVAGREPNGLAAGMRVTVTPDDYGFDPVAGELVGASAEEIADKRTDPTLGEVVVHFPRFGFRVAAV